MALQHFRVYKGLQKPLIYKGFAGKFIIWGIGSVIGSIACGAIVGAVTNIYLGGLVLLLVLGMGLRYTYYKQKRGQHEKNKQQGVFINPVQLSLRTTNKR